MTNRILIFCLKRNKKEIQWEKVNKLLKTVLCGRNGRIGGWAVGLMNSEKKEKKKTEFHH